MSTSQPILTESSSGNNKMLIAMVSIGILCALLIVLTYEGTLPRIERLKAEALEKAIFNVIPGITKTKTFRLQKDGTFLLTTDNPKTATVVYAGYDAQNKMQGIAIEASGQGYADKIRILYGYDPGTQTIVGFYVLESKETPGLGDKIEKDPDFLVNFEALDVSLKTNENMVRHKIVTVKSGSKHNPWELDGITGATISSRAIGDILAGSTSEMVPLIFNNRETFKIIGKEDVNE